MTGLELLRLLLGLPLVLLLPGLAWSLAAFPRHRARSAEEEREAGSLDGVERAAVSLAFSIALVSLGALMWNGLLGLPLGAGGSLGLVLLLAATGFAAWRVRIRRQTGKRNPA